jgi:hypothetical protein
MIAGLQIIDAFAYTAGDALRITAERTQEFRVQRS